jgi:hypothetical protein
MFRTVMAISCALVLCAGCGDVQAPATVDRDLDLAMNLRVDAGSSVGAAQDIRVDCFPITELEIRVCREIDEIEIGRYVWLPKDGTTEYTLALSEAGRYAIEVTHRALDGTETVEVFDSAMVDVAPLVVPRVMITPGQAMVVGIVARAAALINGDFEKGTLRGWTPVAPVYGGPVAARYSAVPSYGGAVPITPPYVGGSFVGCARTGGDVEVGFTQTILVPAGKMVYYSLDYAVRETQIPGQSRAAQTVRLYLNDQRVNEAVYPAPTLAFGHFEGRIVATQSSLEFTLVSRRPLAAPTGWGELLFDNALVSLVPPANSTPLPRFDQRLPRLSRPSGDEVAGAAQVPRPF